MIAAHVLTHTPSLAWEKLPEDVPLTDDPVDNLHQSAIAAALTVHPRPKTTHDAGASAAKILIINGLDRSDAPYLTSN